MIKKIETALKHYTARTGATLQRPRAVMFDMDGILFDSMPGHCKAWKQVCDENGIEAEADEFYAYEGRTGASTIDTLIRRQFGRPATEAEIKDLYARKCVIFKSLGEPSVIPGAAKACEAAINGEALCILVTGSGQRSNPRPPRAGIPRCFPTRATSHSLRRETRQARPRALPHRHGQGWRGAKLRNRNRQRATWCRIFITSRSFYHRRSHRPPAQRCTARGRGRHRGRLDV